MTAASSKTTEEDRKIRDCKLVDKEIIMDVAAAAVLSGLDGILSFKGQQRAALNGFSQLKKAFELWRNFCEPFEPVSQLTVGRYHACNVGPQPTGSLQPVATLAPLALQSRPFIHKILRLQPFEGEVCD